MDDVWYISCLLVDFGVCQLVGVGDLISGLLLVNLFKGEFLDKVLEYVMVVVYEVMLKMQQMGEYEFQVVVVQDVIVNFFCYFIVIKL